MRYKLYICPTCKGRYRKQSDAFKCIKNHQPSVQEWWQCKFCGYGIRLDGATENSIEVNIESHLEQCEGGKNAQYRQAQKGNIKHFKEI